MGKNTRKFEFENVAVFASRPLICSACADKGEKMSKQEFTCIIQEKVQFSVKEHQTLLSFSSDEFNEEFQIWWEETGRDLFTEWLAETDED